MMSRTQVSIIVGFTLVVALLSLWMRQEPLNIGSVAAIFGTLVTVVYGAVLLFSYFLWPWALFSKWLVKRPDLRGTWRTTLISDWKDPVTNLPGPHVEAYMVVRQTLSTLSMRLFTDKSRSLLVAHEFETDPDGLFRLFAVYRNSPKIQYQGSESAIHHGALLIEIHEVKPKKLEGHYWTDRGTRGTIEMKHATNICFASFEEAKDSLARSG
jgi:hypothetical protein